MLALKNGLNGYPWLNIGTTPRSTQHLGQHHFRSYMVTLEGVLAFLILAR